MNRVRVSLGDRSYDVLIGAGLLSKSGAILKKLDICKDAVIITNPRLLRAYGKTVKDSLNKSGIGARFALVPDSEKAKSSDILVKVVNDIASHDRNRSIFIVALGGGVIGDLAGFAASIYKRGVPYVQIPTTLLAQVDSSIGGKTAVDLAAAKNLAGAFYQPSIVISDISMLRSLSPRQVRSGLAEVIKYGAIKDRAILSYLKKNLKKAISLDKKVLTDLVLKSVKIKARLVEADELDRKGKRIVLNYGHTIGHAIEAASSYSSRYNHGEAIAIGMCIAGDIATRLGLLKKNDAQTIESIISDCGLPTGIKGLSLNKILEAHLRDKKFVHGVKRFVLLSKAGRALVVSTVPGSVVIASIKNRLTK